MHNVRLSQLHELTRIDKRRLEKHSGESSFLLQHLDDKDRICENSIKARIHPASMFQAGGAGVGYIFLAHICSLNNC